MKPVSRAREVSFRVKPVSSSREVSFGCPLHHSDSPRVHARQVWHFHLVCTRGEFGAYIRGNSPNFDHLAFGHHRGNISCSTRGEFGCPIHQSDSPRMHARQVCHTHLACTRGEFGCPFHHSDSPCMNSRREWQTCLACT